MLILQRNKREVLILKLPTGERVKVVIVDVKGRRVTVGIEASQSVKVLREEIDEEPKGAE